jgi:hypothetical protein
MDFAALGPSHALTRCGIAAGAPERVRKLNQEPIRTLQ